MEKRLDANQIRESLKAFLDKYYHVSLTMWAARIGISRQALMRLLNGDGVPHRKTMGIVKTFIEDYSKDPVKRLDPTECEVCGITPHETYYMDWGDGIPHWVCFTHMKK